MGEVIISGVDGHVRYFHFPRSSNVKGRFENSCVTSILSINRIENNRLQFLRTRLSFSWLTSNKKILAG